jgi:hypothetical protein
VGAVVDPLSLAALSAVVLTQGIGFLYGQVAELLRRRRDHRESATDEPVAIPPPGEAGRVLDGELPAGPVDEGALDRHADQLMGLWRLLGPYAEGLAPVDPHNRELLEQVAALRSLVEQIYRQHITFAGEHRPATGTPLDVRQAGEVGRYAAQVIASGERAVAVGHDISGVVITGDQTTTGDRFPAAGAPPGSG